MRPGRLDWAVTQGLTGLSGHCCTQLATTQLQTHQNGQLCYLNLIAENLPYPPEFPNDTEAPRSPARISVIRLDIARVAVKTEAFARQDRLSYVVGRRFGRREPSSSAAFRSDAATHAAYTRSVVAPPPPWPRRPATVRRSTPAESSSVAE